MGWAQDIEAKNEKCTKLEQTCEGKFASYPTVDTEIDHAPGLVLPFWRPHARRTARSSDCTPKKQDTVSSRNETNVQKILYDARQDASFSHERRVRLVRAPQCETAASHTTVGLRATGQTASLADRRNGSRPFA